MPSKGLSLSLTLTCFTLISFGQAPDLRFEKIGGLSQSTAYSITSDKKGFLWMGTGDGLNRFDGIEVKVYNPTHSRGLHGRIVRSALIEDDQERLWFSTENAVHSLDKKTEVIRTWPLRVIDKPVDLFANPLLHSKGHLWLATPAKGVFDLDISTGQSKRYPLTQLDEQGQAIQLMYHGASDNDMNLWFATNKGLLKFNTKEKQWTKHFPGRSFYSLAILHDTIFISEGRRMRMLSVSAPNGDMKPLAIGKPDSFQSIDLIHRVYADENQTLWIGDESGNIYARPMNSSTFVLHGNINQASVAKTNYPVYAFHSDPSGVLWVGSYMLGLIKVQPEESFFDVYPNHKIAPEAEAPFVNTFFEESPDVVLLGTFQKGILRLDKARGTTTPVDLPYFGQDLPYSKSVHTIYRDRQGILWTGSAGMLHYKTAGSAGFKSIKIPLVSNVGVYPQVWCITEHAGGLLLGTMSGVYFLDRQKKEYNIRHIDWLGQTRVLAMWKSPDEEIWIAFESGGVKITRDPEVSQRGRTILEHTNVKHFQYDNEHSTLFISTSDGLVAWDLESGRYETFGVKDGLYNTFIYSALQDSNRLWISTNQGLFRATLSHSSQSPLPNASFSKFGLEDGLPDIQFNVGAAYKGMSGSLYFGTPQGIVWFDPNKVTSNQTLPKIVITDINANDEPLDSLLAAPYVESYELPHDRNSLYFRFRGIEHRNPSKVNYSFMLTGWDDDWVEIGATNEVRYSNLPPGNYHFKVKAANSAGAWAPGEHSISVTINPPFWNTWWFTALMATLAVSLIVWITRMVLYTGLQRRMAELERQRELDRERQRISREMHDDIGAGLTQITLISEFARNKHRSAGNELEEIAVTSRQLVNNMSEIIWSLNPEHKSVGQLLSYLREQLNKMLEYSGIDYNVKFSDDTSTTSLSSEAARNIILAAREIVNNAIRHSGASGLEVSASLVEDRIAFTIEDNGKGFDTAVAYRGNGLRNIQARIDSLHGRLSIHSRSSGSRFDFEIPLDPHAVKKDSAIRQ